ncbi:LytTR family DNA-binding domain-containing protein [Virgibacillus sp. SK37]|uniref:LytTR family DNA-binding domain-containing protein n=1 Tax=Virgibacillus sp. SK37 TaxID=403957 RepID=UPI0004D1A1F7|nr:LytTR family DNA-binding domain-containing protein [Virgibacillus sp. SK37]AIF43018.1 histidine kinase [Virgibacillus sp. SK37]
MKVKIDIDDDHEETSIIIHAKEWSEDLASLVKMIKNSNTGRVVGIDGDQSILLHPDDIDYVFAEGRKIFAMTNKQRVELKMKLYEVEELLAPRKFLRFSKSVIGNMEQIQCFEVAFNGNLCVYFKSGNKEYVSRKYVTTLKNQLLMESDKL